MIVSYVRETKDFINKHDTVESLHEGYLLVTPLGVKSLYTNILNNQSIKVLWDTLNNHELKDVSAKEMYIFNLDFNFDYLYF